MAKFRPKVESVDAVQVRFTDKGSWPKWLEGHIYVDCIAGEDPKPQIADGDFIVRESGGVAIYKPDAFAGKFEPSRITKGKAAE